MKYLAKFLVATTFIIGLFNVIKALLTATLIIGLFTGQMAFLACLSLFAIGVFIWAPIRLYREQKVIKLKS